MYLHLNFYDELMVTSSCYMIKVLVCHILRVVSYLNC